MRALDIRLRRRIEGLVPGDYRSSFFGDGIELAQIKCYEPGDDVRRIDWNVTARTGEPHVRVNLAERSLTTWVLLDTSASMSFGTQDRAKADVAEGVLIAVSHVGMRGAGRVGLMTFGDPSAKVVPPVHDRTSIAHAAGSLHVASPRAPEGPTDLSASFDRLASICRRRSAVVVVSDFRGRLDWKRSLFRLAQRHHVLVAEVVDEREQKLVDIGDIWLRDPESGRQVRVDTSDEGLRARFDAAAERERAEVRRTIRATGCDHVVLSTSGDWLRALASHLSKRAPRR